MSLPTAICSYQHCSPCTVIPWKSVGRMKFPLLQHHHHEECIKRTRVSRVNKTLICTASSLRTLGAILLSGTRVGVCGVTLEHFYPTHRVISVSRRPWRLPALCAYSRSLIGSWGFWDKDDDKFFWLSEFWVSTSVVARHEDTAACLTTISWVATEDSSRCMREKQRNAHLHFKPNCKSAFFLKLDFTSISLLLFTFSSLWFGSISLIFLHCRSQVSKQTFAAWMKP